MVASPPSYPTTASVSSTDLFQITDFTKVAPPYIKAADIVSTAIPLRQVYNTTTNTTTGTLTASSITGALNKVFMGATGTLANATGLTLPTVAATVAAITPVIVAGQTYELRVINKSSANFIITLLTSTGWTLSGTMTMAQNTWRDFVVTFPTLTTATLQEVGVGTDS